MLPPAAPSLRWPARLATAASTLRNAPATGRSVARAALWPVLHAALFASLRAQAGRIAGASAEDLEDLASQKSLELLARAEEGAWDPCGRAEHEVAGYVARVARHALVDLARRRGREAAPPEDPEAWEAVVTGRSQPVPGPEERLAAREFATALRDCVSGLAPRARYAWQRRAFLERPSREIAAALGITAAHVDVVVQRARVALRRCMESKGHDGAEVRCGAIAELWLQMSREPETAWKEEVADDRD